MGKKYVASIMNRLYLGDNNFLFYMSHTEVGEVDPKTNIFKDRNGNEYLPMNDASLTISEVSNAYANLEEMSKLPKRVGQNTIKDAISEYNYLMNRFIYYVSKTDDDALFCVPIEYAQFKDNLNYTMQVIKQHGGLEKVAAQKEGIPNPQSIQGQPVQQSEEEQQEEEEPKTLAEKAILSSEVRSDIAAFFMELMEGLYSLDELKEIRQNVELQKEDIESLMDSLDLQIEASEKGESSIKLKNERPHALEDTLKTAKAMEKLQIKDYIDLDYLFQRVTRTLIAQDEPTRRVITEIARKEQYPKNKNRGLLITGPTGSGKTKMMELIAKYLDRPFFKVDTTQLTVPGYVGKDIEEVLWELYVKCGYDVDKTEHAIIFFDEIDKKGSSKKDDVSGRGVLNLLLPFIEGSVYNATESVKHQKEMAQIDTSNMIVILGGAFTDVYKQLKDKKNIGFGCDVSENGKAREATTQDFVEKAQMPDEFMGRVSIIKLNDLDVEAIKRILRESDESAIKIQQKIFKELGVKLTASDEYLEAIAEQAIKRQTGARGLNTVVDESTWEAYGDAYTNLGAYDEIILQKETVSDPKVYTKVRKKESSN